MSASKPTRPPESILKKITVGNRDEFLISTGPGLEESTIGPAEIRGETLEFPRFPAGIKLEANGQPPSAPEASPSVRSSRIRRGTSETRVELVLDLEGTGQTDLATGIGFLDHML